MKTKSLFHKEHGAGSFRRSFIRLCTTLFALVCGSLHVTSVAGASTNQVIFDCSFNSDEQKEKVSGNLRIDSLGLAQLNVKGLSEGTLSCDLELLEYIRRAAAKSATGSAHFLVGSCKPKLSAKIAALLTPRLELRVGPKAGTFFLLDQARPLLCRTPQFNERALDRALRRKLKRI
jgi:hypothetical protein